MIRGTLLFAVKYLAIVGVVAGVTGVSGYYAHKNRIEPIYSLAERLEVRLRRDLNLRTDTELAVDRIETIFLALKGNVHVMPDRTFQNGGALTVWGDDLLIMHKDGKVFWLDRDQEEGMVLSNILLPDNGKQGYIDLVTTKYADRPARIDALRYNDIEFIDAPDHRGFLLSYTYVDATAECYRSRISWLPVAADVTSIRDIEAAPEDWELVFDTSPCLGFNATNEIMLAYMAGGRMAFKSPNLVYLGSGEYHLDGIYRPDAGIQSDNSDYGKTIEINLDTKASRHVSKGHRNLQGVTLDALGQLWTTEHGMRGGDELNLILDGENYGWPIEDMGTLYNGIAQDSPSGPGRHRSFRAPVYAWTPSVAVSSLALIEGFHPAWDGDLLIGSLKQRTLFRARIHEDRIVSIEPIFIGQRIRDVMQWGPDRIALWLDLNEVVILEIEPRVDPLDGIADELISQGTAPDLAKRAIATLNGCAECHAYQADIHGAGPSLAGVMGRPIAGTAFSGYSDALRGIGGSWSQETLANYIQEPASMVEGTLMSGFGVAEPDLAAAIAAALGKVKAIQRPE